MKKTLIALSLGLILGVGVAHAQSATSVQATSEVPSEEATSTAEQVADLPAPGILPGNPLYFVKSISEGIGSLLTFSAEAKANRAFKLAEKRLAEAKALANQGKTELAERTFERYRTQMQDVQARFEKTNEEGGSNFGNLAQKVAEATLKHQAVLGEVYERVPEEAQSAISRAMEASMNGHETALSSIPSDKRSQAEQAISQVREKVQSRLDGLRAQGVPIPEVGAGRNNPGQGPVSPGRNQSTSTPGSEVEVMEELPGSITDEAPAESTTTTPSPQPQTPGGPGAENPGQERGSNQ